MSQNPTETDSQAMHETCAPVLYKDCVTDQFASFAANLKTNADIDRSTRIHIHHQRHCIEAGYVNIFALGWGVLITKTSPDEFLAHADGQSIDDELQSLITRGTTLRHHITGGVAVLPNLRVISMGNIATSMPCGISDPLAPHGLHGQTREKDGFGSRTGVLPHALLDLPSAQHYCQAVDYGPLSLPGKIIKPKSALKTFTITNVVYPHLSIVTVVIETGRLRLFTAPSTVPLSNQPADSIPHRIHSP
jgi:hypothetical protein